MKNLITILIVVFPLISFSQSWFQKGDQWLHYISSGIYFHDIGLEEVTVVGDTLITGNLLKILSRRYAFQVLGKDTLWQYLDPLYMIADGDSIYYRNKGSENLIYDFSMEVGDSMQWYPDDDNSCFQTFFKLDSVYEKVVDGVELRIQEGSVDAHGFFVSRKVRIYEGIGIVEVKYVDEDWYGTGHLIPNIGLTCRVDEFTPSFCSFNGKEFDYGTEYNCNYIRTWNSFWFKQTDNWIYKFVEPFDQIRYVRELAYEQLNDTLIGEIKYQKLSNVVVSKNPNGDLVYDEQDSYSVRFLNRIVYYWTGEEERVVYDFNMAVGDSLIWKPVSLDSDDSTCLSYFFLDSIYIDTVDYSTIQVQRGRLYSVYWNRVSLIEIYEGIGVVRSSEDDGVTWTQGGFLIPELHLECFFDGVGQGEFCNYRSQGFTFSETEDCYDFPNSVKEDLSIQELKVFPNPSASVLNISSAGSIETFDIFDLKGRKMDTGILRDHQIDISKLNQGVYILSLSGYGEQNREIKKFVKMNGQ